MLTRLKIDGFKNLVGVDLRFGPYTCIAGANGVGKSNLFDAIAFLSRLAQVSFTEAVADVRSDGVEEARLRDLLFRSGQTAADRLCFECELLVPREGTDDLGRVMVATATYLRYVLELRVRSETPFAEIPFELVREELVAVGRSEAASRLAFTSPGQPWIDSVLHGGDTDRVLISTETDAQGGRSIRLHHDPSLGGAVAGGMAGGMPVAAESLPRTTLSRASAFSATAVLARREFASWRRLQPDLRALRAPDRLETRPGIGTDGAHLPATLLSLTRRGTRKSTNAGEDGVLLEVASRLGELVGDISRVQLDVDEERGLVSLQGVDRRDTVHAARSLSEGTLRFLALAIIEADARTGLLCLEEPETGIHPTRIAATVRLLRHIAFDPGFSDGPDNPLRQVIVNTHSPGVVKASPADSLIAADTIRGVGDAAQRDADVARFRFLGDTWRHRLEPARRTILVTELFAYLGFRPFLDEEADENISLDAYLERWTERASDALAR